MGRIIHISWKIKNVWNHQPDFLFNSKLLRWNICSSWSSSAPHQISGSASSKCRPHRPYQCAPPSRTNPHTLGGADGSHSPHSPIDIHGPMDVWGWINSLEALGCLGSQEYDSTWHTMLISGVSAIFWQVAQKFDHETCIVDQDVEAGMQIQNGRRTVGEFWKTGNLFSFQNFDDCAYVASPGKLCQMSRATFPE